ncbi:MAG: hypothetical protein ACTSUE_14955 [Promethearchaeota archaeon]
MDSRFYKSCVGEKWMDVGGKAGRDGRKKQVMMVVMVVMVVMVMNEKWHSSIHFELDDLVLLE